ncbi:hypothetical protein [Streptomyces lichenis]|uniref:Uncharacterized protein n=1 Tax=Streptomyces lichenis TaxID=2306967 RepID=A0ABT0IFW7_9ACTN|nr:hypothetical protein [Streptomyces lichenis]MCK8680233.1 hypothetical protein [Streptomyces lichenis]
MSAGPAWVLLGAYGTGALPWSVLALLVPVAAVVAAARTRGFPPRPAGG